MNNIFMRWTGSREQLCFTIGYLFAKGVVDIQLPFAETNVGRIVIGQEILDLLRSFEAVINENKA